MKLLFLLVACSAALVFGQTSKPTYQVKLTARKILAEGPERILRGDAEMATDTMVLRADEIDYHARTGEAEARGSVRVKLLDPITGDKLADNNVTVQAISMSREQSKYLLRGQVEISTHKALLRADEVEYDADTAQVEARGNVRMKLMGR